LPLCVLRGKDVLLLLNPFTGKAFAFMKECKKITITAVVPEGEKPSTNNNFTYELELED
jgi:hypothetical protein